MKKKVDLTKQYKPLVKDQGQLASSTACAIVTMMEVDKQQSQPDPARVFIYYKERGGE